MRQRPFPKDEPKEDEPMAGDKMIQKLESPLDRKSWMPRRELVTVRAAVLPCCLAAASLQPAAPSLAHAKLLLP
jgi:hypothetical protein